jgi:signal transduction histidine kinase
MLTHNDLVYEQLNTLLHLLMEEAHMLLEQDAGPAVLGYRDDLEALVQAVGNFALRLDDAEQRWLDGDTSALLIHDLRAPLAGILGLSELLLNNADDTLTPTQNRLLQHVNTAGYDLLEIVDDLFGR